MSITKTIAEPFQERTIQVLELNKGYCIICKNQVETSLIYATKTKVYKDSRVVFPFPFLVIQSRYLNYPSFYGTMCNNCNTILTIINKLNQNKLAQQYEYKDGWFKKLHQKYIGNKTGTITLYFAKTVKLCEYCEHKFEIHWEGAEGIGIIAEVHESFNFVKSIIKRTPYTENMQPIIKKGCHAQNCKCKGYK